MTRRQASARARTGFNDMQQKNRISILLVDDRPENLVALEGILDDLGLDIVRATSGNEALKCVLEKDFALVLLDVQMPELDGFETAEIMRKNPKTRRTPIIFVTAISSEQKHVFKGYESGAVDYIMKPVEPMVLRSKVQVFCELYRQREELEEKRAALEMANKELAHRNEQLQHELELARTVQLGFLPKTFPREDRIVYGKNYLICTTLGGDLFDAFKIGNQHVGMYMADVAGHGVGAALISGLLKMAFESFKAQADEARDVRQSDLMNPERVLKSLNKMMTEELPEDSFITLVYTVLDLSSNVFRLASAGHPPPLRYHVASQRVEFCSVSTGAALGLLEDVRYPLTEISVSHGDKMLFYTDGLTESMNRENEEFGEKRLLEAVWQAGSQTPDEVVGSILRAVEKHRAGRDVTDDCSILVVEVR